MKATVLVDNISNGEICGEWGLSFFIETGEKKILLDTGASDLFIKNGRRLGIDIADADYGVISHAHYDHSDGMDAFFKENSKADFYIRKGSGENCYKKVWIFKKYIGLPKGILQKYKERIVYADRDFNLCEGVYLLPHKTTGLEEIGLKSGMYIRSEKGWVSDDFSHEQSLVIDTDSGLVIFNSCSHGGAANIINEVKQTYPDKKISTLIGGFHLYGRKDEEVRELAADIKKTGIKEIYTGHCTGQRAFDVLREELGDMVKQLKAGMVIEV